MTPPADYCDLTYTQAFEERIVWTVHPEAITTPVIELFIDHRNRTGRPGRRYVRPGTELLGWSELRRDAPGLFGWSEPRSDTRPPSWYHIRRIFCSWPAVHSLFGAVDPCTIRPGRRPQQAARTARASAPPWEAAA